MTKKILIADDEQPLRLLVRATLEDESEEGRYEIVEAVDGNEALEIARRERPELILLDIQMPGLSGLDVCKMLKNDPATSDLMIVMLTAKGQQSDRERGFAAGADDYFAKPFSPLELLQLVDRVMG
jgi:two-component system phosphate regulon response regulator PhoB